MELKTSPEVELVYANYPDFVRDKIMNLRRLVLQVATEMDLSSLEEVLKWGEPSFLAKKGSTIRMDWKEKNPNQYAMYFKCTSKLVTSFRLTYNEIFDYEGNRALVFKLDEEIPETELKNCIKAALRYHQVKQLPTLGL
ncbi:uncharacterized protein DUF1801 [Algoriphagus ratkowskyi]|uniref:DUF1801 domain-containing protein n=1 Tax=Algoriphagus ratkowskyi TaxID=57028 RepID=A0A2W7RMV6_9BACT|nr:DUF1801 domain-containing protein [Algoriphagus ratkowskyi]PZX55879.1 uncharacterized protein DUF1801 [Algoriphagus ratkowskyi]TXD77300.1 DUF1801 domain-containing protein [Algoriphagus ratkowskyi]